MLINAFRVVTNDGCANFEDMLNKAKRTPHAERNKSINNKDIKVEHINKRDGLWLMDFTLIRWTEGPGRGAITRPLVSFDLREDEGFGEETAALYDPRNNSMLVQFNKSGARYGPIIQYLSSFNEDNPNCYYLAPVFAEDAEARAKNKLIFTSLSVLVASREMTRGNRKQGMSLSKALELGSKYGAEFVKIEISVDGRNKDRKLREAMFRKEMDEYLKYVKDGEPLVSKLIVGGRNEPEGAIEVIDLVAERLKLYDDTVVPGEDRRLPREARYSALRRARSQWQNTLG